MDAEAPAGARRVYYWSKTGRSRTMLSLVKALLALRLAGYLAMFVLVLAVLGIWSLTRHQTGLGVALLAGVALCLAAAVVAGRRASRH